jgi:hypothetical protein
LSGHALATASRLTGTFPGWAPAVLVLIGTALIGPELGAWSRPLFAIGCGAAGWYAWRQSPCVHLQSALLLFAFAPLVRRVVDLSIGFDETGIMLVGPLLALTAPLPRLWRQIESSNPPYRQMAPLLLVGTCIAYAAALSVFQGDWMNAASGILRWMIPLLYAAALAGSAEPDELVQSAATVFMIILPVTGLYGIAQYVDPPNWDRYWMNFASITSAGQPIPYGVRTFSTMNGPASFATFTAFGLLLVFILRPGWQSLLVASPAALAFLLSLYRTAWISLLMEVLFCLVFTATRRRAATISIWILGALVIAVVLTPFSEIIADRLSTLVEGGQDGSVKERLEQFITLWSQSDSLLFGSGYTTTDVGSAGAMPIDGMIIACWLMMGIPVGLACLSGFIWAAGRAIGTAARDTRMESVIIGAFGCGALFQLPLANISSGELGFLFWTFAALAPFQSRSAIKHGAA